MKKKYKKYQNGKIIEFLKAECDSNSYKIDYETLKNSWRNNQLICDFVNKLFSEFSPTISQEDNRTKESGVFLVRKKDVAEFLQVFSPLQLRNDVRTKVNENYGVLNFGTSKGKTCDNVLIYPTKSIKDWIEKNIDFKSYTAKCKFYVAATRAKYCVGIVCDDKVKENSLPFFKSKKVVSS